LRNSLVVFTSFNVDSQRRTCPSVRSASTATAMKRDIGASNGESVLIKDSVN